MPASWDDSGVQWDDPLFDWDGERIAVTSSGGFVSAHELLTPQTIINIRVPAGSQWSKEEAERWINRLRLTPDEQEKLRREDEEAVAVLLTLLL